MNPIKRKPPVNHSAIAPELAQAKADGLHNIGEAAQLSGVSAKMIRHYEGIGLIPAAHRSVAGYRLYSDSDLHRLRFVKRSRSLGFSIKQIETLLGLWDNRSRESAEVKRMALDHAAELAAKIREMQTMQRTLEELARRCHGDDRPECPILEDLAQKHCG
ncbi:Cu(I)-responsive transcriptional regulator [Lysobacter gummosus]|jgi:Cu(I)-responsive transcriptional regulator|uniref:Cu(I)-responsive transcriptional regulator n=1 Tax=Lysobacter gummosus TaxID=262324 RepID=UPI00362DA057